MDWQCPHKNHTLTKFLVPGTRSILSRTVHVAPQTVRGIVVFLTFFSEAEVKSLWQKLSARSHTTLRNRTWMFWAESNLKASFLQGSYHSTIKSYARFQGREAINSPTQLGHLWTTAMTSMGRYPWRCSKWHSCVGSSQLLSNWTQGSHSRREIIPDARNLANSLGAIKAMDFKRQFTTTTWLHQHDS